tara:strand:- start:2656 stop:2904 length:249 start_codon:yes stop_codon:yes gene_type:complete
MTEEVSKPSMVYRNEEKDYDVSKLNAEGQQAFMMLANLQNGELREAEMRMTTLRAAQAQFNTVIKANLSDEALLEEDEQAEN